MASLVERGYGHQILFIQGFECKGRCHFISLSLIRASNIISNDCLSHETNSWKESQGKYFIAKSFFVSLSLTILFNFNSLTNSSFTTSFLIHFLMEGTYVITRMFF